jgi:hypothetical protein
MKTIFLALLLASTPAFAGSTNFIEGLHRCANISIKATQYATMAAYTTDANLPAFKTFIETEIQAAPNVHDKKILMFLAMLAWQHKKEEPTVIGASVYEDCVKSLGTST